MSDKMDIVAEELAAPAPGARPIEHWQQQHRVPAWKHHGARVMHGWGVGRELDAETYLNGIEAFASRPVGA